MIGNALLAFLVHYGIHDANQLNTFVEVFKLPHRIPIDFKKGIYGFQHQEFLNFNSSLCGS